MSIAWVIAGTFLQISLAGLLFMLAAFAGGGYANGGTSELKSRFMDLAMLAMPGSAIFSAAIVIYQYNNNGDAGTYWWYALPILIAIIYFAVLKKIF